MVLTYPDSMPLGRSLLTPLEPRMFINYNVLQHWDALVLPAISDWKAEGAWEPWETWDNCQTICLALVLLSFMGTSTMNSSVVTFAIPT